MSVSWLIPVRDGRRWIAGCLDSILSTCGADDQLVVVDDGSRDDPKSASPVDPRITWIEQDALGIAAALECGRRACVHPYIARMDVDDLTLPGRLEAQIEVMDREPMAGAVGGRALLFQDEARPNEGMQRYVEWVNGLTDLRTALLIESPIFHPAVLLRADAVEAVGGYRDGDFPEDYDLWLRLVQAGYGLYNVPRDVVRIRDRPGRLTRSDGRYRTDAFEMLKREWVKAEVLPVGKRIAVWGAGKTGRRWLRWLLSEGYNVVAVVDDFVGTERQGVPVVRLEAFDTLKVDCLLVAVGVRGARAIVRAEIVQRRPDLIEGRDWWCLA